MPGWCTEDQGTSVTGLHLTKSRYIAGLQCLRRLWLLVHEPQSYEAPEVGSPAEIGQEIGRKAHLLFPGGVLVDEEPWQHEQAAARTKSLMEDASVPAIFEAAVEADNIRIRVDVLERLNDGRWGLREVKSSSRPKDCQSAFNFDPQSASKNDPHVLHQRSALAGPGAGRGCGGAGKRGL